MDMVLYMKAVSHGLICGYVFVSLKTYKVH